MKIDLKTDDGYVPSGIEVSAAVLTVCKEGTPNCANFMVNADAIDMFKPTLEDLVLVEIIGNMVGGGNDSFRPVALNEHENAAYIEDALTFVNGVIVPVSGYTITYTTAVEFMADLERAGRSISIKTDDDSVETLTIDSAIYVVIDTNAEKRFFGLTYPKLDIVELEAYELEKEEEPEKEYSPEDEEAEDVEEVTHYEVKAVLYDTESTDYISKHLTMVGTNIASLDGSDLIYEYTIREMEINAMPTKVYHLGE